MPPADVARRLDAAWRRVAAANNEIRRLAPISQVSTDTSTRVKMVPAEIWSSLTPSQKRRTSRKLQSSYKLIWEARERREQAVSSAHRCAAAKDFNIRQQVEQLPGAGVPVHGDPFEIVEPTTNTDW